MTEEQENPKESLKREYELAFLLVDAPHVSLITEGIKKNGGEINHQGPVVSIRLAYPINKHVTAFFGFCHFIAEASAAKNITTTLKESGEILRVLLLTPPPKPEERVARPISTKPVEVKPATPSILTNEALEQKLEEILK